MDWPITRDKAIHKSHTLARRGHDIIVVTTDLPHIFDCFSARHAHVFEESPRYDIIYYALAHLAEPEPDSASGRREKARPDAPAYLEKPTPSPAQVQTLDSFYARPWGEITRLKIYTPGYQPLSWREVWQAFSDVYPGRWAVELYPPAAELVDEAHVYHLWLLPEGWTPPSPMNLAAK